RAAEAEMMIAQRFWIEGRRDLSHSHSDRALALLADAPASRSTAWVLARSATRASLKGDHERAIEIASKARAVSEQLEWHEGLSDALSIQGILRVHLSDRGGIQDIERSIELALASGPI